ncbi:hypothetical protein KI387_043003, partial [Taxus chinensis]
EDDSQRKVEEYRMNKGEDVTSYLTRLRLVKDELAVVGDSPSDDELVRIALNGFTKQWDVFVQVVSGRDTLPSWDRLWTDFTQEEFRLSLVNGANKSQKSEGEQENVALAGKGKAKKGFSKGSNYQSEKKKKDLSKVKCFGCHEFGHYVSDCPEEGRRVRSRWQLQQVQKNSPVEWKMSLHS